MNWIAVEQGGYPTNEVCLVCGLNNEGGLAMDFGYWKDEWYLSNGYFTPRFYAEIEWPPELIDEGGA